MREEVTVDQIIQGHRQIIDRAHALGLKVYGGTLNPVEGYPFPGFWTPVMEEKRQAVNRWIRTSHAYDAVMTSTPCCVIRFIPRVCCPTTTAAITYIRMTLAIASWPMPSTSLCSATTTRIDRCAWFTTASGSHTGTASRLAVCPAITCQPGCRFIQTLVVRKRPLVSCPSF